jgi:hypothetical protein
MITTIRRLIDCQTVLDTDVGAVQVPLPQLNDAQLDQRRGNLRMVRP